MSKTVAQIYANNPSTTILDGDLIYMVQSPYTPGTDTAILGSNLKGLFLQKANNLSDLSNIPIARNNLGLSALATATPPLSLTLGGTGASLVASNGGIFYSNATTAAILAGTATAGQIIRSGASSAPSWSTATYPSAAGSAGNVLTSDGTNWNSTAPAASGIVNPGTINELAYYAATGSAVSGLATAASGTLITSAGGVPSISQTLPSAVQGNITSLGTISSGTWNGSIITGIYGGTGVNNGASTITVDGNFAMSGGFTFTGTLTGNTGVTFPTSGTLATTSQLPTPAALTKVDDTNVTLTLGGTPATALLEATSLTLGWTGQLSGTRGGTGVNNGSSTITIGGNVTFSGGFTFTGTITGNTSVTFPTSGTLATTAQLLTSPLTTKGDIWVWSTTNDRLPVATGDGKILQVSSGAATGLAYSTPTYPSASGSAGKILRSDGTNNVYTTSTFADTYTASNLLYSNGANTVTGLATANNGILTTDGSGVPSISNTVGAGLTMPSITFNTTTGVVGTTTNDNAAAGSVGEFVSSVVLVGSAVSLTTNVSKTITSISLTAGDWDVQGEFAPSGAATTVLQQITGAISLTNNTIDTTPATAAAKFASGTVSFTIGTSNLPYYTLSPCRISVSGTTTVYLVMNVTFITSTATGFGKITARRVR